MPLFRSTKHGILVAALFGTTVALVTLVFIEIRNRRSESQKSSARDQLGQMKLVMTNYQNIQGHQLLRIHQDKNGRSIGWREEIAPYFHHEMLYAIEKDPSRADEFQRKTSAEPVMDYLRLHFDTSPTECTSLVGVYDEMDTTESAPWAIAAIRNTGIAWKGTRDLTIQEFVSLLDDPDEQKRPLAILTANREVGRIDNSSVRFNLLSRDQRSVKTILMTTAGGPD